MLHLSIHVGCAALQNIDKEEILSKVKSSDLYKQSKVSLAEPVQDSGTGGGCMKWCGGTGGACIPGCAGDALAAIFSMYYQLTSYSYTVKVKNKLTLWDLHATVALVGPACNGGIY